MKKPSSLIVEVMKGASSPDKMMKYPGDEGEESEDDKSSETDTAESLKEMWRLMKSGDFEGAAEIFQDAVASCG